MRKVSTPALRRRTSPTKRRKRSHIVGERIPTRDRNSTTSLLPRSFSVTLIRSLNPLSRLRKVSIRTLKIMRVATKMSTSR
jgi:hypothetical protein